TFKLLKYLCTSQWYWCLPGFDLVVAPWMVWGQEMSMSHVAVLPPMFQPQILSIFVAVWTCKLSFRASTRKHSISWEVINCPKKKSMQFKILPCPCIPCCNTLFPKILVLQY